jgi:beta-xylosidase
MTQARLVLPLSRACYCLNSCKHIDPAFSRFIHKPQLMSKLRLALLFILVLPFGAVSGQSPASRENLRMADPGNGSYRNPILGGDYPDPSVLQVGNDYYMTHSSFVYYPGLLILHSTDLVNWQPVCYALHKYVGSVYAPDFIAYKGKYYIYFPAGKTNWVVTAPSPEGPWSDPIDLKVGGIDPGHVVEDGKRYLYLAGGKMVRLSEVGLSTTGNVFKVYDGWDIPDTMNVECKCLEGPKSTYRNGYYYLTSAEGGTAGPATSHMVISARSKSALGPWTNSPYNPVVHTWSRKETWWSQGHGSLVSDIKGNWWIVYHAYENGYRALGRQTLLLPVEWTEDGWFRVPPGIKPDQAIKKPAGRKSIDGMTLSDDFGGNKLGLQWQFFKEHDLSRAAVKDQSLYLEARSSSLAGSSPLLCIPLNHSYSLQVEVTVADSATGGITLFYNEEANVGVGLDHENVYVFSHGRQMRLAKNDFGDHAFLKLINRENEIFMYYSTDGKDWHKLDKSLEVSGLNQNAFNGFLSLRAGLFSFGKGQVKFDHFIYRGL